MPQNKVIHFLSVRTSAKTYPIKSWIIPDRAIQTIKSELPDEWVTFSLHSRNLTSEGEFIDDFNFTHEYKFDDWEENIIL
jgi:hypothetical protein